MKTLKLCIVFLSLSLVALSMKSCATPRGIELRHERKIAKIKVDSIRASRTTLNRTTNNHNVYTPFNGYQYNWHGTGFGFYRPQVIIPIKRKINGNNRNINPIRGNRGHRPTKPVRVPKVQRPKVRTQGVPVRRGRSVPRGTKKPQ